MGHVDHNKQMLTTALIIACNANFACTIGIKKEIALAQKAKQKRAIRIYTSAGVPDDLLIPDPAYMTKNTDYKKSKGQKRRERSERKRAWWMRNI